MAQITIEINDETYETLTHQALRKGLRPEEELQRILVNNLEPEQAKKLTREEFIEWLNEFSKQVGPQKTDSADIIRELRENS